MINVYVQYSISGFKIFHLNSFPHIKDGDTYINVSEIAQRMGEKKQDTIVTPTNMCGMSQKVAPLFSTYGVNLIMHHETIEGRRYTYLYVNDSSRQMSYAFRTDMSQEVFLLVKMAALWLGEEKSELARRLASLVCKDTIENDFVLMFKNDEWEALKNDIKLSRKSIDRYRTVQQQVKGIVSLTSQSAMKKLKMYGLLVGRRNSIIVAGSDATQAYERNVRLTFAAIAVVIVSVILILIF